MEIILNREGHLGLENHYSDNFIFDGHYSPSLNDTPHWKTVTLKRHMIPYPQGTLPSNGQMAPYFLGHCSQTGK